MEFADYAMYGDGEDHRIDLRNPHFRQDLSMHNPDHFAQQNPYAHHLAGLSVDVKPRLTKEQHDILESHYQQQNKPNTQTKKGFAEALGVSLDKVNNWFQNRRAKSKQDAKKQAGAFNMMHGGQQPQLGLNTQDITPAYLSSELFGNMNDSAVNVDPMALHNGLGISQPEHHAPMQAHAFQNASLPSADFMNAQMQQRALKAHLPMLSSDSEAHRRTLTQEQFDAFNNENNPTFVPSSGVDSLLSESPALASNSDLLNDYFPELCDFNFDNQNNNETIGSVDMQPEFSTDSYASHTSSVSDAPSLTNGPSSADTMQRNPSMQSSGTDWSDHSTPSVSITPANPEIPAFDDSDISPRGKSNSVQSNQWQPGQSVPVDFAQMEREFKEAAMRSAAHSSVAPSTNPDSYTEEPLAYPTDEAYSRREFSTQLAQGMNNLGISNEHSVQQQQHQTARMPSASGSIAARRQRPRPVPLGAAALRSTSFHGTMPTSPGPSSNSNNLAPATHTLRKIKSHNVMNGFASGRIQKNVGSSQRSPLNFTFAEAMNSPKFARRVSSYSPAQGLPGSANLAPPTPLSPNDLPGRMDHQRSFPSWQTTQAGRQPSICESLDENMHQGLQNGTHVSNNFSSPPATPMYATQFARGRMGNAVITENTPPQSAPASQQCFPGTMLVQPPPPSGPILQSQSQMYMSVMPNEYPQMPNIVMPSQPLHVQNGQYMDASYVYANNMNNMVPNPMRMQYSNMGYANQQMHQANQQSQFPFVPSSPGVLMSSNGQMSQQHKIAPAADFFVHEYSPPQEMKRVASTPRKMVDAGPRNYTFANHGPEHFEGKSKKGDIGSSSPSSSADGSSTA